MTSPNPRRDPQRFFDRYTRHNPPADQALLQRPDVRAMFLASYAEATRQGIDALRFLVFATLGHLWYACCANNQAAIGSGNPTSSGQLTRRVTVS